MGSDTMGRVVEYKIVISDKATDNEKRAAVFLRNQVRLVCGELIPIVTDATEPTEKEIVIGTTERERAGFLPERGRKGLYQYVIKSDGERLFICGLGIPDTPPEAYTSAYRYTDEGDIGTLMGVYRFTEEILGYDFIFEGYSVLSENRDAEIPENCLIEYTTEGLRAQKLPELEGECIYMLPVTAELDWNVMSFVIRTRSGRLIVIDGGQASETEYLLDVLKKLAPKGEIPTVSTWLLTHLHGDHYGAFTHIVENYAEYKDRVRVENYYCNLAEEEFYTTLSREAAGWCKGVRDTILGSGRVLGGRVHTVNEGDEIEVDGMSFRVIHVPNMQYAREMNMNDSSVVYKLTASCGQTVMFLGDAEWVCSNDLLQNHRDELKSDVVQVSHHGCGGVSKECYAAIGAEYYLWQLGNRFWYGEKGQGLNTHNTGVIANRNNIMSLGAKREKIFLDVNGIRGFEFPIK